MYKTLLQTGCLALILSGSALAPALADESTPAPEAETAPQDTAKALEPALSRTAMIVGNVRTSAERLEAVSRNVLSGDGDRNTSKVRQLVSRWASRTSSRLKSDLSALEASEERLMRAEISHNSRLADIGEQLRSEIEDIEANLKVLKASEQPETVREEIPAIEAALEDLRMAEESLSVMRPARLEIEFASELTPEASAVLLERVTALEISNDLVLAPVGPDEGVRIVLEGEAPNSMTSEDFKALLPQLFAPIASDADAETEAEPVELPERSLILIELGDS